METRRFPEGEYTVRCKNGKIVLYAHIQGQPQYEKNGRLRRFTAESRQLYEHLNDLVRSVVIDICPYKVVLVEPELWVSGGT